MTLSVCADAYAKGGSNFAQTEKADPTGGYIGFYAGHEDNTDDIFLSSVSDLPQKYDSRDFGYISSVKYQGFEGCCWAFAEIGAIEANLVKKGLADADTVDFSEAHAVWFGINSYDDKYKDGVILKDPDNSYRIGGNDEQMIGAFSKRSGLEYEEKAPYDKVTEGLSETQRFISRIKLKNCILYSPSDIENIKRAVMEYGAVTYGMYGDWSGTYMSSSGAYYYPYVQNATHEVLIVGWDDTYSRNNFSTKPKRGGAWIVRNSYGEDFCDNGYMMVSYENFANMCHAAAYDVELEDYDNIYLYDGGETNYYMWWTLDEDGNARDVNAQSIGGNIFTAENDEVLKAVSYHAHEATDYEVRIYRGNKVDGDSEEVVSARTSGVLNQAGYYTIPLNDEVRLSKGEVFTVAIVIGVNKNFYFELPTKDPEEETEEEQEELNWNGYGKLYGHYEEGQSFIGYWKNDDIQWWEEYGNVGIRALTDDADETITEKERAKVYSLIESAKRSGNPILAQKAEKIENGDLTTKSDVKNAYIDLIMEYADSSDMDYIIASQAEGNSIEAEIMPTDEYSDITLVTAYYNREGRLIKAQQHEYYDGITEYVFENMPDNTALYKIIALKDGIYPCAYYSGGCSR